LGPHHWIQVSHRTTSGSVQGLEKWKLKFVR
jgi:hypothetical protein